MSLPQREYYTVHEVATRWGRGPAILAEREKIKKLAIQNRRLIHQRQAA